MNSDEEYESELADQLGWEEANRLRENTYEVPATIIKYHQIIEANNRVSIFDNDDFYASDEIGKSLANSTVSNIDDGLPGNEAVIRVISGRGRGGRSVYQRPGAKTTQEYLDVTMYLRKVAPLGYGNAITENAIREHRASKRSNKENVCRTSTVVNVEEECRTNETQMSALSPESSTASSASSSEYFTSRSEINSTKEDATLAFPTNKGEENANVNGEKLRTTTAVPISEILRATREQYKKMRLQKLKNSENPNGLVKPPETPSQ